MEDGKYGKLTSLSQSTPLPAQPTIDGDMWRISIFLRCASIRLVFSIFHFEALSSNALHIENMCMVYDSTRWAFTYPNLNSEATNRMIKCWKNRCFFADKQLLIWLTNCHTIFAVAKMHNFLLFHGSSILPHESRIAHQLALSPWHSVNLNWFNRWIHFRWKNKYGYNWFLLLLWLLWLCYTMKDANSFSCVLFIFQNKEN